VAGLLLELINGPAACSAWRHSGADSMSERDKHDPTADAGDMTAGVSLSPPKSIKPLACGRVHIRRVRYFVAEPRHLHFH